MAASPLFSLRFSLPKNGNYETLPQNLHREKDFAEAEAHYTEALRINPRAAFAHNSLGHLLHHRKKVTAKNGSRK